MQDRPFGTRAGCYINNIHSFLKFKNMARVKYNVVTHGISGKIGDLLEFRQRNGKTVIAKIGHRRNVNSPAQVAVREKFRDAATYAKAAVNDSIKKEIYALQAAGDVTAFNLAFKDFYTAPAITAIDTSSFNGNTGELITVTATDDTKVESVLVTIMDSNGDTLESGDATKQDGDTWAYAATTANGSPGRKLVVEARDMPGNVTMQEKLL
jgi:hypothetical protein